jgi:hypothetical protein
MHEFTLHLYKLSRFKDLLDDFESYGLLDCSTMFKILMKD